MVKDTPTGKKKLTTHP